MRLWPLGGFPVVKWQRRRFQSEVRRRVDVWVLEFGGLDSWVYHLTVMRPRNPATTSAAYWLSINEKCPFYSKNIFLLKRHLLPRSGHT